ncbi:histone-lysine N-methyltransferase SETMAR-like isoform X2 [Ornithodoros turicata]|uniref:histone-lysine N-methyltransferase SETMAR-like isoform X2 n=1 Tax=Ornithodoros turicata TaxID=34597 RepID=UPI0031399EC3
MADNEVSAHIEQQIVMKFLVNEGVKSFEIHRRLQTQYGHDTLSRSKAFEWCKRFRDGRTSVQDDPARGGSEPSVRVPENIQLVKRLILKDRRITCTELARKTYLSVGTLNTIIHEHLQFRKVSARWVPRQLSVFDRQRKLQISRELRYCFDTEGQPFLDRIITCDETWVHHFTPESKRASKQWKHPGLPAPKKCQSTLSAGKVMATVFWDKADVVHVDFRPSGTTINSAYYCKVLRDVHKALKQKRPGFITKGVLLLQDNARPHTAHLTSRLRPQRFPSLRGTEGVPRGRHLSCDDEVKNAVRLWLLCAVVGAGLRN